MDAPAPAVRTRPSLGGIPVWELEALWSIVQLDFPAVTVESRLNLVFAYLEVERRSRSVGHPHALD